MGSCYKWERAVTEKAFVAWIIAWAFVVAGIQAPAAGETLYNGITLGDKWPPQAEKLTRQPMPVPYLENPPEVILIDVGRQLFVDDFLIEHRTFGPEKGQIRNVPGHEEIEIGLVKLYQLTGSKKYLDTAKFFICRPKISLSCEFLKPLTRYGIIFGCKTTHSRV